jgi:hypothetical protein
MTCISIISHSHRLFSEGLSLLISLPLPPSPPAAPTSEITDGLLAIINPPWHYILVGVGMALVVVIIALLLKYPYVTA